VLARLEPPVDKPLEIEIRAPGIGLSALDIGPESQQGQGKYRKSISFHPPAPIRQSTADAMLTRSSGTLLPQKLQ
jgi:hypothetical protein